MDKQLKLFNKEYVESQVRQVKEVRHKQLKFKITESDRAFSKSIYVNFYWQSIDKVWLKGCALRISDHIIDKDLHKTFLIKPENFLDIKTKMKFARALELTASDTIKKSVRKNVDYLSRRFNDETDTI